MTTDERFTPATFNRPPRLRLPELHDETLDIPAPPAPPPAPDNNLLVAILPIIGIGVMALFYVGRAIGGGGDGVFFAAPMFLLAAFTISGTLLAHRWRRRDHERRRRENRLAYLRLLESKRARLQAAHDAQTAILETTSPPPSRWLELALARDPRLWERRPDDDDFVSVRLGVGRVPSPVAVNLPNADSASEDLDRAYALADAYRFLRAAPVIAPLRELGALGVYGSRTSMMKMARAMLSHLAATHAPDELRIHVIAPTTREADWRWLEWLPHVSPSGQSGMADLLAFDHETLRALLNILAQELQDRRERRDAPRVPHLLVVIDDIALVEAEAIYPVLLREARLLGASVICLAPGYENLPGECGAVVEAHEGGHFGYARGDSTLEGDADSLTAGEAEHLTRALAALLLREAGAGGRIPRRVDFLQMVGLRGVEELSALLSVRWGRSPRSGVLPYPILIGMESATEATELRLDENHHGPHGVLAGTTGSGKSELMQTMVCSLALEHDPRLLTLLLIDFKGGSAFSAFAGLPHVVGTVTNLDGTLVGRALEALKAEVQTRQQFLKSVGARDIGHYHRLHGASDAQPLPHLVILVDEFAQLAREMPDFLRELVRVAQMGRSLGLHLILGTQSPMDVITDEMNANLQFRICLRVQNVEASRAVLRRPDAAYLPAGWPGRGYFQVGEQGVFKQFQTAYVSGDYRPQPGEETLLLTLVTETGEVVNLLPDAPPAPTPLENRSVARAVCEAVTEYANMQGVPPMPPLLLPPLPDTITLLPPFDAGDVGGWNGETWLATDGVPPGSAPAGMVDDVYNRAQYPLWIHLAGGESDRTRRDGHVIVVGSPASGKTTFIRTLALSQALLHPPEALHMYFLSFTGTGLDDMGRLPHAERVIHGADAARVRRLFARLIATLDERQAGRAPRTPLIMVCIDQFEGFRDAYRDQHMPDFDRLINEGRAAGIALVITASTITAIPDRVRAQVEQRIALHLGDPADTLLAVGRLNTLVDSARAPGRGFLHSSPVLTCQISLPCLTTLGGVAENMNTLIDAMRAARPQQAPSPIRELPTYVPFEALPTPAHTERVITPLGWLDDDRLSVYMLDWREAGMHFVVAGAPGSGKTNLLHVAALAAAAAHSPADLRFVLVDIDGRSLRAIGGLQHVAARVTDPAALSEVFARLRVELAAEHEALSNNGAAPRTPATIVLIDDYDALGEALRGDDTTLALLRDCARLYPDLPFHIWVAGYFERVGDPLLRYLLLRRAGFGLGTRDSLQKLNVRTAGLPADLLPAGRMFVPERDRISIVQTALVENPAGTVGHINDLWGDFAPATWSSPTPETPRAHRATRRPPTEIDTAGLIEDLLGASDTD